MLEAVAAAGRAPAVARVEAERADRVTALERERLPGVRFRPARFLPTFHKWADKLCDGVQIHVTDAQRFKPFLTGLAEISVARRLAPRGFAWRRPPYEFEKKKMPIDILCGTDRIRVAIEKGTPLPAIERAWQPSEGDDAADRHILVADLDRQLGCPHPAAARPA